MFRPLRLFGLVLVSCVLGGGIGSSAFAAPDAIIQNSLTFTMNGASGVLKPNADGTYTVVIGGTAINGTWVDKGDLTCFTENGSTVEHCAAYPADMDVGDSVTDRDGITLTLVQGR